MTPEGFRAMLKSFGLTPIRSVETGTLYRDREQQIHHIPDPEIMEPRERERFLNLLKIRMGITDN